MARSPQVSTPRLRRLGVAAAKSKLSEVLRDAAAGPTVIHSRGRDIAVVLAVEDYERLTAEQEPPVLGGARFLERVAALKGRHGTSGVDFEPARLDLVPAEAFPQKPQKLRNPVARGS